MCVRRTINRFNLSEVYFYLGWGLFTQIFTGKGSEVKFVITKSFILISSYGHDILCQHSLIIYTQQGQAGPRRKIQIFSSLTTIYSFVNVCVCIEF